jgi:O-antigen ligase
LPEIALGGLMVVGTFKGAPQLNSSPIDLTILLLLVLVWSMAIECWNERAMPPPKELMFYVPIVFMMFLSLLYTPNVSDGIDKTARFCVICGASIVGPFIFLTTPTKLKRFFLTLLAAGLIASLVSIHMLGGRQRLATPGGDTIQLGHVTAVAIAVVWFGLMPGQKLIFRALLYACIGLLAIGLIGSGSRGPIIGLGAIVLISIWQRKRVGFSVPQLLFDFGVLILTGVLLLPFVSFPQESLDYLGRLTSIRSGSAFLGPRADLLQLGWRLMLEHPVLGVGIGGFPVLYTGVGNWPHNIPLEIGSELGVIPALSFCCFLLLSVTAALNAFVVRDKASRTNRNLMFCFLVIVIISMLNTGNLNDNRQLWTALSLPFLFRTSRVQEVLD